MISIRNFSAHLALQYVIAINCCANPSMSFILHRLKMMNVQCMDVVAYSAVRDFKFYFDHLDAAERVPLLFILSDHEACMVHDYRDLEAAALKFAA